MNSVYDDKKQRVADDHNALGDDLEKQFDAPAIDDAERNAGPGPQTDKASKDELGSLDDKLGAGFTGGGAAAGGIGQIAAVKKVTGFFFGNKKRSGMTALVGGGSIAALIGLASLGLGPLKLNHIMSNIDDRAFGAIVQNSEDLAENILSRYLIRQVFPGMVDDLCTSTNVSRSCAAVASGDSQVARLWNVWRDNNIEGKLASKHGIEITRSGSGANSRFFLRVPDRSGTIDLGRYSNLVDSNGNLFNEIPGEDRNAVRQAIRQALVGETKFKNRIFYHNVGKLLERKYGIKRCLVMCGTRDKWNDSIKNVSNKINISKGWLIERIVGPRSEAFSLVLECAASSFSCAEIESASKDGSRMSNYEKNLAGRLSSLRTNMGTEAMDKLISESRSINSKGMFAGLIEKSMGKLAGSLAGKAIPIAGWTDLAVAIYKAELNAGPALEMLTYNINSSTAVQMYAMYNTATSEMMLGDTDMDAVGSLVSEFDQNPDNDQGGGGATDSPLWSVVMNGTTGPVSSKYQCNNPDDVPAPVCPEETFDSRSHTGVTAVVSGYSSIFAFAGSIPLNGMSLNQFVDVWDKTAGWLFDRFDDLIGSIISLIPGLDGLTEAAIDKLEPLITAVSGLLMPMVTNTLTTNPSGSRMFNITASGAYISAADYGRSVGGEVLSEADVALLTDQYDQANQAKFASKSLFDKIADTSDSRSVISQLALAMPSSGSSLTSLLTNPLQSLSAVTSIFTPSADAASQSGYSALGITPIGYKKTDPIFTSAIENYEADHQCSDEDNFQDWANSQPIDGFVSARDTIGDTLSLGTESDTNDASNSGNGTGQMLPTETNGCMLLGATISALGSEYDESFENINNRQDDAADDTEAPTEELDNNITVPSGSWVNPMAGQSYTITSRYGPRSIFGYSFHYGTDLAAPIGTPYTAAKDGKVTFVGAEPWGTVYIKIDHGDGLSTEYGHSYMSGVKVKVGDQVRAGQVIAVVGNSGTSTGAHLHFNVKVDRNYTNPEPYMRKVGAPL